jgi:hypothetical protein
MAKFVLKDAEIVINAVDLSEWVNSTTLDVNPDLPEANTMGTFFKVRLVGLSDATLSVTFTQNFDSGAVDATLWPLVNQDAPFVVTAMANKTDGIGVTNPKFTMDAVLGTYQPLQGTIGDTALVNATFPSSGALVRSTS